jgi:hypothetical protein
MTRLPHINVALVLLFGPWPPLMRMMRKPSCLISWRAPSALRTGRFVFLGRRTGQYVGAIGEVGIQFLDDDRCHVRQIFNLVRGPTAGLRCAEGLGKLLDVARKDSVQPRVVSTIQAARKVDIDGSAPEQHRRIELPALKTTQLLADHLDHGGARAIRRLIHASWYRKDFLTDCAGLAGYSSLTRA